MKRFLVLTLIVICSLISMPVSAISENQKSVIVDKCDSIKNSLKQVQKDDARVRIALGGRYEAILTNFITPLNVRLVENGLSSADLVENQNDFSDSKALFNNDYIKYQQELEDLIALDCKGKPEDFYNKLEKVRQKRKIIKQDALKIRSLLTRHVNLVTKIEGEV